MKKLTSIFLFLSVVFNLTTIFILYKTNKDIILQQKIQRSEIDDILGNSLDLYPRYQKIKTNRIDNIEDKVNFIARELDYIEEENNYGFISSKLDAWDKLLEKLNIIYQYPSKNITFEEGKFINK